VRVNTTLFQPLLHLTYTDFNTRYIFQVRFQLGYISFVVMIGIEYRGLQGLYCVGQHFRRHGIGQVHRQGCVIGILQRLHSRRIFRVSRHIDQGIAKGKNISVPGPFRVICFSILPLVNNIVSGDRLYRDPFNSRGISIFHDDALGNLFGTAFGEHNRSPVAAYML